MEDITFNLKIMIEAVQFIEKGCYRSVISRKCKYIFMLDEFTAVKFNMFQLYESIKHTRINNT